MNYKHRLSFFRSITLLFPLFFIAFFSTSLVLAQSPTSRTMIWKGKSIKVRGYDIMVEYAPGYESVASSFVEKKQAAVLKHIKEARTYVIRFADGTDLNIAIAEAIKTDGVITASPVIAGYPLTVPEDYYYTSGKQWALKNTGQDPPGGEKGAIYWSDGCLIPDSCRTSQNRLAATCLCSIVPIADTLVQALSSVVSSRA